MARSLYRPVETCRRRTVFYSKYDSGAVWFLPCEVSTTVYPQTWFIVRPRTKVCTVDNP